MTIESLYALAHGTRDVRINPRVLGAIVGNVRCLGDYDTADKICLWHGKVSECHWLNGVPICPLCGSSVKGFGGRLP